MASIPTKWAILVVSTLAFMGLLLVPRSGCACATPDEIFRFVFGVDPESAEDADIRASILRGFPVGTSDKAILAQVEIVPGCREHGAAIDCDVTTSWSFLRVRTHGVSVHFEFDAARTLTDVRAARRTTFLGMLV